MTLEDKASRRVSKRKGRFGVGVFLNSDNQHHTHYVSFEKSLISLITHFFLSPPTTQLML